MPARLSLKEIRDYWTQQALTHGQSASASWTDHMAIELEIREISKFLDDGDAVLDVGCANGFATVRYAAQRAARIVGVDYIVPMVGSARARRDGVAGGLRGTVELAAGNVLQLGLPSGRFDKVIATRVIINLSDWANQLRGLLECCRVLKVGGVLLLSEATLQGWRRMNVFRTEWSLPPIPMPAFNNYLDEEQVVQALLPGMELQETVNFSSTYFVGTRVLKPLLAQACGLDLDVADPDMEWNRWFAQLPAAGDYGPQKLLVFRKRTA